MRVLRTWTVATLLMVLAACGTQEPSAKKENEMAQGETAPREKTPEEALAALKKASQDLMAALAPGVEFTAGSNRPVPCGGFGGSEYSKIHIDLEGVLSLPASDSQIPQDEELFTQAEAKLKEMGLTVSGRQKTPAGDGLVFGGDGFGGKLLLHVNDALMIRGQTACLDNVDELR